MSEGGKLVLFFVVGGIIYWIVGTIGNKIADKGNEAIGNAYNRKKNFEGGEKKENLSDRYRQ